MLPFRPHAVVFDMDGLLIESEVLYRDSFLAASEEGGHGMQVETYQKVCGSPWDVITGTIFADYGADFPMDAFRDAWLRHLGVMMAEGVALKPGVAEILDLLDRLDIRRAIATSSQHTSVTRHLGPYDLLRRFDTIVARGDYTEPKPAPMPYLTAAKRLGLEPGRCLALEDSYSGVRSAASAGMMTIMVPDVAPPTEEMREKCVAVMGDLHAVADMLRDARLLRI
ncbi:Phosphorylated carbohydrates phosphatase [Rhizobium rhizogenes]|uniref:Phosphorylated carbohydrates phosphatase n=1 Tax=Rhizobium rhizogenes TaxID=359 RepID=A0AAN2DBT0_RHIRH|nr:MULTISPECIES: HAD family phosphatase [Rhizobium/Agrobacterium group]AQS62472.1 HAD family phosphatase [Rhizobium rhizogenes]MCZ7445487.1 HAD family phosphatase [Rhizobium rhizogenes]NSZ78204.1 HAD family phosphatase [Agrobacterium tumefaciens]OAM65074.1 HAD family hydrolase [Rhizobium rhizogenes]CAD0210413.1 Phosphorylated carbohydrates phosphatase [Rhizobium rhizogenes]